MKFLAYRRSDGSDKAITIDDVIKGRKLRNPLGWEEGVIYYSLWDYYPMKAVVNGKKPHFAYKGLPPAGHSKGGEGIEHSFSKHILSELPVLKIRLPKYQNEHYEVPIKGAGLEHPAQYEDRKYRIDVLLEAYPCEFTRKYGSERIGVEIFKSNKTRTLKRADIRQQDEDIILLEVKLLEEIKLQGSDTEFLMKRLKAYWSKEKSAICLHTPNYKELYKNYQEQKTRKQIEREQEIIYKPPVRFIEPVPVTVPIAESLEPEKQKQPINSTKRTGSPVLNIPLIFIVAVVLIVLLIMWI